MNIQEIYTQYKQEQRLDKKQRELDEKQRILKWKQDKKEEKLLREKQRKEQLIVEKNLQKIEKIEKNKQLDLLRKQSKEDRVRKIVDEFYVITSDPNDKVQSSILGSQINDGFHMFINSKLIFEILLSFEGISSKKSNNSFFCGLKVK